MFFGTKKGKVYVEDQASGKRVNAKSKPDLEADPVNGDSTITFVVPKLPKRHRPRELSIEGQQQGGNKHGKSEFYDSFK